MEEVSWGILGAGNIARRFAASLASEPGSRLVAASGRDAGHLARFCADVPCPPEATYLDHQALLDDGSVDAVYVALPHGLHEEWVVRALDAGKAVLCEKPLALSAAQATHMAGVARERGVLLMEAMKARLVPLHAQVMSLVRSGELGAVTGVETIQRIPMDPARGGYIVDPTMGGLLYDVGIYAVSWIEELLSGEVSVVSSTATLTAGVDWSDDARLEIGGVPAHLVIDGGVTDYQVECRIQLERGTVVVETLHRPTRAGVYGPSGELVRVLDAPYVVDDFFGEVSHFSQLVRDGERESDVVPLDASIRMASIVDAIRAERQVRQG